MIFQAVDLGELPHVVIGELLRIQITPGIVHLSRAAQAHSFGHHGADFLTCLPHAASVVLMPDFVGQSPRHPEGFELVKRLAGSAVSGGHVLVAIGLTQKGERYLVASIYPIARDTVARRLRKGHLFHVF